MKFLKKLTGWTPLQLAAQEGNKAEVEQLLGAGADINQQGNRRCTPLVTALIEQHWDIAELLLSRGADPLIADKQGNVAIHYSISGGPIELVRALIDAGADVNARGAYIPRMGLTESDVRDKAQITPVFVAAIEGNLPTLELLIENGAAVTGGANPLVAAAEFGHTKVVNMLLEAGAEADANPAGLGSALLMASQHGHVNIAKKMIELGADVNAELYTGATSLILAANYGHHAIVKALLKAGADVDRRGHGGATALIMASQCGYQRIVKDLLNAGADKTLKLDNGSTARDVAEATYQTAIVSLLDRYGRL